MNIDLYEVLQVSPRAEAEVIEAAYRRLAQKYHPDRNKAADAAERMKSLNAAYAVLRDPLQRAQYDRKRQPAFYASPPPRRRPTPRPETYTAPPAAKPNATPQPPPKPKPPPNPPYASTEQNPEAYARDVFVSEALVNDSLQILKDTPSLTVAVLQRRLGIGNPRADRLFQVLIARGIIDHAGNRLDPNAKTHGDPKHGSEAGTEQDLASLVPQVLRLLRTEKQISVAFLQEKFQIGFARAMALYQLLSEQQVIDKAGKPTSTTKARLATKDLGAAFACPFCEQTFVHHYQTVKRLLPDTHYFKCPVCMTEFEQVDTYLFKLVQVPEQYALLGKLYKNRSFSPAQWKVIKKAEIKNP